MTWQHIAKHVKVSELWHLLNKHLFVRHRLQESVIVLSKTLLNDNLRNTIKLHFFQTAEGFDYR